MQRDTITAAFRSLASLGYLPRVPIAAEQFADAAQRASWISEKGMQVLNFHSDRYRTQLRLKQEAGRPQDQADIAALRMLHPGGGHA